MRRTWTTQVEVARATKQTPRMVTSLCDGDEAVSLEAAVVAKATGMVWQKREMNTAHTWRTTWTRGVEEVVR